MRTFMRKTKFPVPAALLLLLCCILAGCGGNSRGMAGAVMEEAGQPYYDTGGGYSMAKSLSTAGSSARNEMDLGEAAYEYEEEAFYDEDDSADFSGTDALNPNASSTDPSGGNESASTSSDAKGKVRPEKLVYTGNLTVETTDFSATLARVKENITQMGGFIESEDDSDDAYGWYMDGYRKSSSTLRTYIQARIPSARFYEFLDGVEGDSAKVTSRSVNVQNISRRYSETATTIESYEIQERRLLEMMEDAKRVSDMLEIEARLSEVQGYLKQYRNSLADMDTDVAYSTVSISIREVGIYTRPEATSFGDKLKESFSDGIWRFRNGVESFCVWLAGSFLQLILYIIILWLIIVIIKKLVRRRRSSGKEKKAGRKQKTKKTGESALQKPEQTPDPELPEPEDKV